MSISSAKVIHPSVWKKWKPIRVGLKNGMDRLIIPIAESDYDYDLDEASYPMENQIIQDCPRSDFFHNAVHDGMIFGLFKRMGAVQQSRFIILTEFIERVMELNDRLPWAANIALGVIVHDEREKHRINLLQSTGARVKVIAFDPLIGPIGQFPVAGIDWIAVGTGVGACSRPTCPGWVRQIKNAANSYRIPIWFRGFNLWSPIDEESAEEDLLPNGPYQWPDGSKSYWIGENATEKKLDGVEWERLPKAWEED